MESSELSQALCVLAERTPITRDAFALREMAADLDAILDRAARYADAPTRNDLAIVVGRVEAGLAERLDQLFQRVEALEARSRAVGEP